MSCFWNAKQTVRASHPIQHWRTGMPDASVMRRQEWGTSKAPDQSRSLSPLRRKRNAPSLSSLSSHTPLPLASHPLSFSLSLRANESHPLPHRTYASHFTRFSLPMCSLSSSSSSSSSIIIIYPSSSSSSSIITIIYIIMLFIIIIVIFFFIHHHHHHRLLLLLSFSWYTSLYSLPLYSMHVCIIIHLSWQGFSSSALTA